MYRTLYEEKPILKGKGEIVYVTGWTKYYLVSPENYAAIGNLISTTEGIDILIRNLLFNPHVSEIRILAKTKLDHASKCLFDFFKYGVREEKNKIDINCLVINSDIYGYIDIDLKDYINELRNNINYSIHYSIDSLINSEKKLPKKRKSFYKILKKKVKSLGTTPSSIYNHTIEGETIEETWLKLLNRILINGEDDEESKYLFNVKSIIYNEVKLEVPEYLTINKNYSLLESEENNISYTYSNRIRSYFGDDQIQLCINSLKKNLNTRRAVINLWSIEDFESETPPCLNHIYLRVIKNKLILTATFRGHAVYCAWFSNVYALKKLQKYIAQELGIEDGVLIVLSQSVYIQNVYLKEAYQVVNKYHKNKNKYNDEVGYFVIKIEDDIVIQQRDSEIIYKVYKGKNPLKLIKEICSFNPTIEVFHIGYLGTEIQKAKYCLENNLNYEQT